MASDDAIEGVLTRIEAGEADLNDLVQPLYAELRRMADRFMRNERPDHTLQPTALVNETFLRCATTAPVVARTRNEFLALAAQVMRNTLVDHARKRTARKRQAPRSRVSLSGLDDEAGAEAVDVLALNDALDELGRLDPRQAEVMQMSAFGGMTGQEIADQLGVHRNTVVNDLRLGRAWLRRALAEGQ